MTGYARARGLTRRLLPVPVLTPRLSSYWVHLVTPIPASIAQPLIKGLGNEVIVRDASALKLFPAIQPLNYATAVRLALEKMDTRGVETAWSDALTSSQGDKTPVTLISSEGMIIERRQRTVSAPADAVYRSFARLGGARGWLYMDWAREARNANAEVDFVISRNQEILPVEVKARKTGTLRSTFQFLREKRRKRAVRFHTGSPALEEIKLPGEDGTTVQLLSLPLYTVGQLDRLLGAAFG